MTESSYPYQHHNLAPAPATTTYSSSNQHAKSAVSSAASDAAALKPTKPSDASTAATKQGKRSKKRQVRGAISGTNMSDIDSVRTEDIEREFRKAMVQPASAATATSTGEATTHCLFKILLFWFSFDFKVI